MIGVGMGMKPPNQGLNTLVLVGRTHKRKDKQASRGAFGTRPKMHTNENRSWPTSKPEREHSNSTERFWLRNSLVTVERGPVGIILKVERFAPNKYELEYAGPVPESVLNRLAEVAWYVD